METHDFRVYFTPLAGVLFTVPSRYCALSVAACSLPWTVVSPASDQVLRAWPYSGEPSSSVGGAYRTITCCGAAFQAASASAGGRCHARQSVDMASYNPCAATAGALAPDRFRRGPGSFATTTGVVLSSSGY
jgi:hypothetical protein